MCKAEPVPEDGADLVQGTRPHTGQGRPSVNVQAWSPKSSGITAWAGWCRSTATRHRIAHSRG